jgi:oxygen-dependent protoporphyrinogen oxidase
MPQRHVIVIGGGLAGLAAAEAAADAGWQVTLLEASGRFGGIIETVRPDGWLVERSADSFLANRPEAIDLVGRLGLAGQLVGIQPAARRALVVRGGRLLPVPAGFRLMAPGRPGSLLASPVLSLAGRLRTALERWVPRRSDNSLEDESLESFAVRRLGREAFERLVQPLVSGIWTADPARLSMQAACPDFLEMERVHGSLTAGERFRLRSSTAGESAAGARYGQFVSLAGGMGTLPAQCVEALIAKGVALCEATAESIQRQGEHRQRGTLHDGAVAERSGDGAWRVSLSARAGPGPLTIVADAVVLAVPARVATLLVSGLDPDLSARLGEIPFAGSAIVSLGFRREQVTHPLDAAGMVVPRRERRRLLAASFSSSKFPGRAPPGHVLIRGFVGGALDPGAAALGDAELRRIVRSDLADLLGASGEPVVSRVDRWERAMPQYTLGHLARLKAIDQILDRHPGLAVAGGSYRGVGIPQVIRSGRDAFAKVSGG